MRSISEFAKRWMPPIILGRLQSSNKAPIENPIWRGIYPRRSAVPAREPIFDDRLISAMAADSKMFLAEVQSGKLPYTPHDALAFVVSVLAKDKTSIRILDFGGGLGLSFIQLCASILPEIKLDYVIFDLEAMNVEGRRLFAGDDRVSFISDWIEARGDFDIVYANSVLQYIDDYVGALKRLALIGAPHLMLGRLASGHFETYATEQLNISGQTFPYWFLNAQEVKSILRAQGYRLVCETLCAQLYDQSNFPKSHRSERMRNMLFTREETKRLEVSGLPCGI